MFITKEKIVLCSFIKKIRNNAIHISLIKEKSET